MLFGSFLDERKLKEKQYFIEEHQNQGEGPFGAVTFKAKIVWKNLSLILFIHYIMIYATNDALL